MRASTAEFATWTPDKGDGVHLKLAKDTPVSAYTVIGYIGEPIVLSEKYHPDQGWLAFMQGTILRYPPGDFYDADTPMRGVPARRVREMMQRPARMPHGCEKMYQYNDPDQYQLPFVEFRYVDSGEANKVKRVWERRLKPGEKLAYVGRPMIASIPMEEFIAWGTEAFVGRFIYDGIGVVFENPADAVLVTFRFRGVKVA